MPTAVANGVAPGITPPARLRASSLHTTAPPPRPAAAPAPPPRPAATPAPPRPIPAPTRAAPPATRPTPAPTRAPQAPPQAPSRPPPAPASPPKPPTHTAPIPLAPAPAPTPVPHTTPIPLKSKTSTTSLHTSTSSVNGNGAVVKPSPPAPAPPSSNTSTATSVKNSIQHILQQTSSVTGQNVDANHLFNILHQALHQGASDPSTDSGVGIGSLRGVPVIKPIAPVDDTPAAPAPDPAAPPPQPVLITSLGSTVVNSSDEPIAAVPDNLSLPTTKALAAEDDPVAAAAANNVATFDPTAPKFQEHAQTWQNVIDAGRTGSQLNVNGQPLANPALVTTDTAGNVVKVPLTSAVDAPATDLPVTEDIQQAAVQFPTTAAVEQTALATAATSDTPTANIPPILVAENLAGHEQTTVPPGFVLAGDIKLFGGLAAERYTFHGAAGDDTKAEMAVITKSPVSMDDLLSPSGFSFGGIMLQHPAISVYSAPSSTGRDMGLWLDAGLGLDGPMADAGSILKDIFADNVPSIDMSVHLGGYQGLGDAFKAPSDLLITGTLVGLDAKIGKFLELNSAKVEIHGTRAQAPATGYSWAIELTGAALFTVPGSVAPLTATYAVSRQASTYTIQLHLTQGTWTDAMGVPGFHLDDTVINATFTKENKDTAFAFDITASLHLDTTVIAIEGHYSSDAWDFHATVGDFTLQNLESAFAKLFKANLDPCNHNVVFTELSLDVNSKDKSLLLKGGVNIDSYAAADATLSLGAAGVNLTANMDSVTFDKVTITKAQMQLIITKGGLVDPNPAKPGTNSAFTISGELQVSSVTLDAEVSFAKAADTSLAWVVYAKATLNLTLSKFIEKIPADLDLALENVVVMASNTNTGDLFPIHNFDYTVKKGFQLFAKIDCPPALAKAMHSNPVGMILELDLGSVQQEVDFVFAATQNLVLKPGMISPNIRAGIMLTANPQVFIEGDMAVQLSGQPGPLIFDLRLQAGATEAQASASLQTDWVNPFNISPKVKVLAPVTLGVIIDYAAATYPSGLNFQGGLQVGETLLHAAFEVGENPEDGVLLVQADNLGIRDIVSFASLVIDHQLPMPSDDFIFFKDLYLGISSGGTIGGTFYPPGATFNADMLVFGKEIKIHCAVDKTLPGFALQAEIEAFSLGPLTVSGDTGKNPTLDLEFGAKLQHLLIDGKISLFDSNIAVHVEADMVPLAVSFDAELKFSDLLMFKLQAHVEGEIKSIKDVVKSDFSLYADFEQTLLDHMMALANSYIAVAKKATDEGIDSAKAKLDDAEKSFNDRVAQAQRSLTDAQAKWDKKTADVHAVVEAKKKSIADDEQAKRAAVDKAHAAFNSKIESLEHDLNQAKSDAASKIQAAQNKLTSETTAANNKVNDAVNKLNDAQKTLSNSFGDADSKIKDAENKVNDAQRSVNSLQQQVNDCQSTIDHGSIGDKIKAGFKIAGLKTALVGAKAALGVANGVLDAARGAVNSVGYKAAQAALDTAKATLAAARSAADASIAAAKGAVSAAQAAANASVSAAQHTLDAAKTGCEELHVWNAAQDALNAYTKGETALLSAADAMIQDLSKCAEKVTFDAAGAALAVAKSATKELDAAKDVLNEVQKSVDEFASFGQWLVKHAGNIFNVKRVELSGSLNNAADKKPFMAHIQGTFADAPVDVSVEFSPGEAESMVKGLVMKFVDDAKADMTKFIKSAL